MTDRTVMAEGERVVRRYPCTAVDRVALILGTVIPLPGSVESEGVLTVTNRRVIFEIEAGEGAAVHRQETSLSSISSVSSMMSKFGRDLRLPIAFIVIGFLLMFAPYVALYESGEFDIDGDYKQGFNDGVEFGYFETYLKAVQSGEVSHTIPYGYDFYPQQPPTSAEYGSAYREGYALGQARAEADIAADAAFSVPTDLMVHSDPSSVCIPLGILGAIVFVMGSVLYMLSNTTKDWIGISLGSSGNGIAVKSFNGGWRATGYRALTAEDQYWAMTRELGATILEMRGYREHRLRCLDDDVYIDGEPEAQEAPQEEERAMLPPVPDFDDYDEYDDGELIVDDDWNGAPQEEERAMIGPAPDFDDYDDYEGGDVIIDDDDDDEDTGPRIVGPWRERSEGPCPDAPGPGGGPHDRRHSLRFIRSPR